MAKVTTRRIIATTKAERSEFFICVFLSLFFATLMHKASKALPRHTTIARIKRSGV